MVRVVKVREVVTRMVDSWGLAVRPPVGSGTENARSATSRTFSVNSLEIARIPHISVKKP
jgi:hypothetical protein